MVGAGRPRTGARRINMSFCYQMEEVHTLEAIEQLARERRSSFSNLIVGILKEEVERIKRMTGSEPNPLGLIWNETIEQQPTEEERKKIILDNYETAFQELLTITPNMPADEFKKLEGSTTNRLNMNKPVVVQNEDKEAWWKIAARKDQEYRDKQFKYSARKSSIDTIIPTHSQEQEQEPEISIKEEAY